MVAGRVIVVSDTHLSPSTPEADANWDAVVDYVDAVAPAFVVHLGDLTRDGAHDSAELAYARARLDRLSAPWRAIPGNHDIGDNPLVGPVDGADVEDVVDDARHADWCDVIGNDFWSIAPDGWHLVALDAQLFGTDLGIAADQWSWLESTLSAVAPDERVALLTHKPITAAPEELERSPGQRFVRQFAPERFDAIMLDPRVALVLSGHVHQYRVFDLAGVRHAWAPTTWAVLPERFQQTVGAKRCGVMVFAFDGAGVPDAPMVEPPGLGQFVLGDDIESPYG